MIELLFLVLLAWQEDATQTSKQEPGSAAVKVRKFYVPANDMQKFVKGRFLPIEIKKLDEFLAKNATVASENLLRNVMNLSWTEESGLSGIAHLELRGPTPSQVQFESNLEFISLITTFPELRFVSFGKNLTGLNVLASTHDTRISLEVSLPESANHGVHRLDLPFAEHQQLIFSVPADYRLITNCETLTLCDVPAEGESHQTYLLLPTRQQLLFQVVEESRMRPAISTTEQVSIVGQRLLWESTFKIPRGLLFSKSIVVEFSPRFRCLEASLNGQPAVVTEISRNQNTVQASVQRLDPSPDDATVEIILTCSLNQLTEKLQLAPVKILDAKMGFSKFQVDIGNEWKVDLLENSGFHLRADTTAESLKLDQFSSAAAIDLVLKRNRKSSRTTQVEIDSRAAEVLVKQSLTDLSANAALRLSNNWEVTSVVDVLQDELPVGFKKQKIADGVMLLLENQGAAVQIRASRRIERSVDYTIEDFVPVQTSDDPVVVISNSFVPRFGSGIKTPFGLPAETPSDPGLDHRLSDLIGIRFQLPADNEKFQSGFDYVVTVNYQKSAVELEYEISWNVKQNRTMIIELDVNANTVASFKDGITGTVRLLSRSEKERLGLPPGRRFWALDVRDATGNATAKVGFAMQKKPATQVKVPLPKSFGAGGVAGFARLIGPQIDQLQLVSDSVIELPITKPRERVFQVYLQNTDVIVKVLPTRPDQGLFRVLSRKMKIRSNGALSQTLQVATRDIQLWKIEPSRPLTNVTARLDQQYFSSIKDGDKWQIRTRPSREIQTYDLQLDFAGATYTNLQLLDFPTVTINGQTVETECRATADPGLEPLRWNQVFSRDLANNLYALFWMPSLAFDSYTTEELFPWNQNKVDHQFVRKDAGKVFLLSKNTLAIVSLLVFSFFAIVSVKHLNSRHMYFTCLASLLFSLILAGIFAFLWSFIFWGTACGMLIRQLQRLCQFSRTPVAASLAVSSLFFFTTSGANSVSAQTDAAKSLTSQSVAAQSENQAVRQDTVTVPAIIPLDDQEQPTELAYVPASFYERISKGERTLESIICRKSEVEISSMTTEQQFSAAVRLELTLNEAKKIVLPFFVPNAVYDSNAVTLQSKPVSFVPDASKKTMEIEVDRSGDITLQIDFLVPIKPDTQVTLQLPFNGITYLVNRSGSEFEVTRSNARIRERLSSNDRKALVINEPFSLQVKPVKTPNTVRLIELIDLRNDTPRRSIKVIAKEPFSEDFRFEVQGMSLTTVDQIKREKGQWAVESTDRTSVELKLDVASRSRYGEYLLPRITSSNHTITDRFLLVTGTDATVDSRWANSQISLPESILSEWNSNSSVSLSSDDLLVAASVDMDQESISVSPPSPALTCLAQHDFFVSRSRVQVQSQLDLSCDTSFQAFQINVPGNYSEIKVSLGGKPLSWLRTDDEQVMVFAGIDQPGRYLFEFSAEMPVDIKKLILNEPTVQANVFSSTNRVFCDRAVMLYGENLVKSELEFAQQQFASVGSIIDLAKPISARQPQPAAPLQMEETISFEQGKIKNTVALDLSKYSPGTWIGIQIPFQSTLLDPAQLQKIALVDESTVFARKQIWFPIVKDSQPDVQFEFLTKSDGNVLTLCSSVNSAEVSRKVLLPNSIGQDQLAWSIDDGNRKSESGAFSVFENKRTKATVTYTVDQESGRAAEVLFAEFKFLAKGKRLTSRFHLIPNENSVCRFRIPSEQMIDSIAVCGRVVQWQPETENTVAVRLLNDKQLQLIDIRTIPDFPSASQLQLHFPTVLETNDYQGYFQCDKTFDTTQWNRSQPGDLSNRRSEFLTTAIETFDLSNAGTSKWQQVIRQFTVSIDLDSDDRNELLERFQSITTEQERLETLAPLEKVCRLDQPVYEVSQPTIELKSIQQQVDYSAKLRIAGVISAVALMGFFLGRMPHRFKFPIVSLLSLCAIWVFGVLWVSLTPESIFAWCWILFALMFAVLFVLESITQIRKRQQALRAAEHSTHTGS